MSLLSLLAFSLLCWLTCAATAGAGEPSPTPPSIWSGLVLATNESHPTQAPPPLRKLADKLKNIFGYNQFEVVGEYSEKMDDPSERWLIPSKDFYLSVKTHNAPGERFPMKIALFQNHRRLAEFQTRLDSDSPLFIRGPLYAGGQLVIVLRVKDPSEIPEHPPRMPVAVIKPTPAFGTMLLRARERFMPLEHFGPMPLDHFSLMPDHFGFMPDRFGPGPGPFRQGPGDFDQRYSRP